MNRAGHQEIHGETIAQFEFSQQGWNPFRHYRDEDQVDLLLRRRQQPDGPPEYREIQVKWCRTWGQEHLSAWQRPLFTHVSWRGFSAGDFIQHRPELFVAFVLPAADGVYNGDIFLFTSQAFHDLIQRAPLMKQGTSHKAFVLGHTPQDRWFLLFSQNKFPSVNAQTCCDVTPARRDFALLDVAPRPQPATLNPQMA